MYVFQVVETLAKLHIVMEYAGGGELFNRISNEGKFAEPEARIIFAQVTAAMEHMVCSWKICIAKILHVLLKTQLTSFNSTNHRPVSMSFPT